MSSSPPSEDETRQRSDEALRDLDKLDEEVNLIKHHANRAEYFSKRTRGSLRRAVAGPPFFFSVGVLALAAGGYAVWRPDRPADPPAPAREPVIERSDAPADAGLLVGSMHTRCFHTAECRHAQSILTKNRVAWPVEEFLERRFEPCRECHPVGTPDPEGDRPGRVDPAQEGASTP